MSDAFDFDLGGVVGVRALNPGPRELRALERQLGTEPTTLQREPDIHLCFAHRLAQDGSRLRLIGLEDAAFTDDAFLLLRGKSKTRALVTLPFEDIGRSPVLRCQRGLAAVPLLVSIVNATMLAKGYLALHASAFVHAGQGVIATGWSKGGKTEALLAFMAHGARYVADEWLYLAPGGRSMFGLREPIRLWSWQLASLPELRERVAATTRARLGVLDLLAAGLDRATADGARHGSGVMRTLNRARALVRKQLCADEPPEHLFPGALEPAPGTSNGGPRPERVLFVVSHGSPEIVIEPIDAAEVAERMCFSLAEEDQRLVSCYHKFRFAFPGRRNELIEEAAERRREMLHEALRGRRAYEVRHPYPVSLPALYRALEPYCT